MSQRIREGRVVSVFTRLSRAVCPSRCRCRIIQTPGLRHYQPALFSLTEYPVACYGRPVIAAEAAASVFGVCSMRVIAAPCMPRRDMTD